MMCIYQLLLRREEKPDLPFHKAYALGPSTKSQRSKSGGSPSWMVSPRPGKGSSRPSCMPVSSTPRCITLRFIYFKKVREDIENMVELHNILPIRRQKGRSEYTQFGPREEKPNTDEMPGAPSLAAGSSRLYPGLSLCRQYLTTPR
jgi:hypothetical protein